MVRLYLMFSAITTIFIALQNCNGNLMEFQINKTPLDFVKSTDGKKEIIATSRLENRRNFFHLFDVNYLLCFFAAKGKWPFIPQLLQLEVNQVGRSLFAQNDLYIRSFCSKWFLIHECHRPIDFTTVNPPMTTPTTTTTTTEMPTTEPEPEPEPTTVCTCGYVRSNLWRHNRPTFRPPTLLSFGNAGGGGHSANNNNFYYFDRNQVANFSSQTILNTIEFLQSFLSTASSASSSNRNNNDRNKKKKKTKGRVDGRQRLDENSSIFSS